MLPRLNLAQIVFCFATMIAGCGSTSDDTGHTFDDDGGSGGTGAVEAGRLGPLDAGVDSSDSGALACDGLPNTPQLVVCVEGAESFDIALAGPVIATGAGMANTTCLSEPSRDAFWFQAADVNGTTQTVAVSFPGLTNPLTVGDVIDARAFHVESPLLTPPTTFVLRNESDSLLAYIGQAGEVSQLELPVELGVALGEPACVKDNGCGAKPERKAEVTVYDMKVTAGGEEKTLAFGATDQVGSFAVTHAGLQVQTLWPTGCADFGNMPSQTRVIMGAH
jgi:hypothetical protein